MGTKSQKLLSLLLGGSLLFCAGCMFVEKPLPEVDLPAPAVAWNCRLPVGKAPGDRVAFDLERFVGQGTDTALTALQILPSAVRPEYVADTVVRWTPGPEGTGALALGNFRGGAETSGVLECGTGSGSLAECRQLSVYLRFKLNGGMSYGGGSPPWELDGNLIDFAPHAVLAITGRGPDGRSRRLPLFRLSGLAGESRVDSQYLAEMPGEIQVGQWYRLVMTWDGTKAADVAGGNGHSGTAARVRFWLDGRELPAQRTGQPLGSPERFQIKGPILLGGNRAWNNLPLELAGFAIYPQALTDAQAQALCRSGIPNPHVPPPAVAPLPEPPEYERLTSLNRPAGWQPPESGFALQATANDTLEISFPLLAKGERHLLRFVQPVPLDTRVETVDFWACGPALPEDFSYSLLPLFGDAAGKEITGEGPLFLGNHIGAPNARRSGLWLFCHAEVPRKQNADRLLGFELRGDYRGNGVKPGLRRVYVKDIGLDRLDYRRTPLYYVVGNYRENFVCTGFNNCGARALTGAAAGTEEPFVLLDNLLDQAKSNRPALVDLRLAVYDIADRLVYQAEHLRLPAVDVPDFQQRLPLPVNAPGTYRICGKSWDAASGAFYTADWVKLVIIRGSDKDEQLRPVAAASRLQVNPALPYGVLPDGHRPQLEFRIGRDIPGNGPCELRWSVIPYTAWLPGRQALRPVQLTQTRPIAPGETVRLPWTCRGTAELVVAELWRDGKCLDREERPLAVGNELAAPPVFTAEAQIPGLADLAGPGRNWLNVQFHSNPGNDLLAALKRDIGEAKKLTPNLGIGIDLNELNPLPGVYHWDRLTPFFDLAAAESCRLVLYLNLKWPVDWAPVEFQMDARGRVHRGGVMWGYMVGKYLYPSGEQAPEIIRRFNRQVARRYLNHPGLGAYYFENEHMHSFGGPLDSYHDAARRGFAAFLARRYGSIRELNRLYGTAYRRFDDAELPEADQPGPEPRKVAWIDYRQYRLETGEQFLLRDEFDAVRREDPKRPILVYNLGDESDRFLRYLAAHGGMMANGGVHSNFHSDFQYDRFAAVPGLLYRMEPHDMWNYDPVPHGFDEMIFGMLGMGGRGLGMHIFLPGAAANTGGFNFAEAMKPGQRTGFDKLFGHLPMRRELRNAEKLYDPIGIMELWKLTDIGGPFEWTIWNPHCALYVYHHYQPRTVPPMGNLAHLDGSRVIFLGGAVIDGAQTAYLQKYLEGGGKVVLEASAARYRRENPDAGGTHAFLDPVGIDFFRKGTELPGLPFPHDVYPVGKGAVLVLRRPLWNDKWDQVIPAIMTWAGVDGRLADSQDRFMQLHVLQNGLIYYLATTHRAQQQSGYSGPPEWSGNVAFSKPLPAGRYRVTEMMASQDLGLFSADQLAAGFAAGAYQDLEMKVFRIAPERQ